MGKGTNVPEAQCHPHRAYVDGAKVTRLTPGDLLVCHWLVKSRDLTKGKQKSAEVIVAAAHGGEGPNTWSRTGTERSMPEGDADKMAERPERTRRAGGGTAEGTGRAHQAGPASGPDPDL